MQRCWGKASTIALTSALAAVLSAAPARAINDLTLVVAPGSQTARPGDIVTVRLDASNLVQSINGVQVLLRYNPALLSFVDAVPTDLGFSPPNAGWFEVFRGDAGGDLTYAVSINGGQVLINHTIATFTFQVIAEGVTSITFRANAPPFLTKLTAASNNSTVLPNKFNSGSMTLTCDDGLFCNGAETFDGLVCQPGADPCNDAVACTDDTCNETADTCSHVANSALCDDGLYCNGAEFCDPVLDCRLGPDPCDDAVACTDDSCIEATDTCVHTANDLNCDDGLFCNGPEFCDPLLDCQLGPDPCDDGVGCTNDSCAEASDTCGHVASDLNCPDDGLFCDGIEFCDAVADCSSTGNPCLATQFCNDLTDTCDQCAIDTDCNDGVPCTIDRCVAGACTATPDDAACSDGLFCNGAETCDLLLGCQAGTDPCNDGVACTNDSCAEATDTCSNVPSNANCDDGLFCNGAETCDVLLGCQAGTDPCNDGVACTNDSCAEATDTCSNVPSAANCDDALFCNGAETCDALLGCQAGNDPCNDGVACTDDSCNEAADTCSNAANDVNCTDGVFCNGAETCDALLGCQLGFDPCDDSIACTVDACNETADTCSHTPDNLVCDDTVFCNGAETCDALLGCQASTDPCAPLFCDEAGDRCLAPLRIANLEVYYPGQFANAPDTSKQYLAAGSTATIANVTNYWRGVSGIRIFFDQSVVFQTTPAAAFGFEWTTGTGTTFSAATNVAANVTVTAADQAGSTVVTVVFAANYCRGRWLKVTLDAAQVTTNGVPLDGELAGNPIALPSGDGNAGGNAVFFLGNVPGDVTGDRKPLLSDIGVIRAAVNPFVAVPITSPLDVDKDGKVLLTDVGRARLDVNPFFTLPLIAP